MVVLGDKEVEDGTVSVRDRHEGDLGAWPAEQLLDRILSLIHISHVVEGYGKFSGMDRDEAREAVVAAFEELGPVSYTHLSACRASAG